MLYGAVFTSVALYYDDVYYIAWHSGYADPALRGGLSTIHSAVCCMVCCNSWCNVIDIYFSADDKNNAKLVNDKFDNCNQPVLLITRCDGNSYLLCDSAELNFLATSKLWE